MKIPLLCIPRTRFRKFLRIEKRYRCDASIVPLGCDCHPAQVLKTLHLRECSLPFDWLNISPMETFAYVNENLRHEFRDFLRDVRRNERGHFIAGRFPCAEFMHEPDLDAAEVQAKFRRRTELLRRKLQSERIAFLHNLPASAIADRGSISAYLQDVRQFLATAPAGSTLHVYLRHDEALSENQPLADELCAGLTALGIRHVKYVRHLQSCGIWGDPRQYHSLLTGLGLRLRMTFPKVYVK